MQNATHSNKEVCRRNAFWAYPPIALEGIELLKAIIE